MNSEERTSKASEHFEAGKVYLDGGRPAEAIVEFTRALEYTPHDVKAYYYRGLARDAAGLKIEALNDYSMSIKLKPDFAMAYCSRGVLKGALDMKQEALADFDKAIALKPYLAQAFFGRGNLLRDMGRNEDALKDYTQAIKCKPDYGEAYQQRGLLQMIMGNGEEGAQDLTAYYFYADSASQEALQEEGAVARGGGPLASQASLPGGVPSSVYAAPVARKAEIHVEAVMFLDLRDSTGILNKYGVEKYLELFGKLEGFIKRNATKYGLLYQKGLGDGCLAVFQESAGAAKAAVKIMKDVNEYNTYEKDELKKLHVGIGIDFGKIMVRADNDRFGEHVVMASRLLGLPGCDNDIYVTGNVYHATQSEPDLKFTRKGLATIKGFRKTKYEIYSIDWKNSLL